jgi:hypothetical protein
MKVDGFATLRDDHPMIQFTIVLFRNQSIVISYSNIFVGKTPNMNAPMGRVSGVPTVTWIQKLQQPTHYFQSSTDDPPLSVMYEV